MVAYVMLFAVMVLLSVLFHLASVFRLTIPLAYALIVPTLFHGWLEANRALGDGIFYALLGLTVLSWVVSLVKKIRQIIDRRREDKFSRELFLQRIREARENGEQAPDGSYNIRMDDLWREV